VKIGAAGKGGGEGKGEGKMGKTTKRNMGLGMGMGEHALYCRMRESACSGGWIGEAEQQIF
jgi:hypothetical protein